MGENLPGVSSLLNLLIPVYIYSDVNDFLLIVGVFPVYSHVFIRFALDVILTGWQGQRNVLL